MAGASRNGSRDRSCIAGRVRRETCEDVARLDVENVRTLNGTRARVATAARVGGARRRRRSRFFSRPVVREGEGSLRSWRARRTRSASASAPRENRTVNTAGKTNSRVSAVLVGRVARARRVDREDLSRVVAFALRFPRLEVTPVDGARATRATAFRDRAAGESFRGRTARDECARRALVCDSTVTRAASTFDAKCPAWVATSAQHELRFSFATRTLMTHVSSDPLRHSRGKFPPHLYGQTVRAKLDDFSCFHFGNFPFL